MDFRHLIVTCLFSMLRLPFDNQKVKENYAIFFFKHQGLFGKHQGLFATFSASCIFFNVRTHRNTHTVA